MGESGILVHSYSFAAPITRNHSHEDNTIHALSQSISFGKFVTENLEWGKWSSFPHKNYVEEAEKSSRPGSVAQKKAFFEAHYKRIAEAKKAAATEEQPIATPAQALLHTLETHPPLDLLQLENQETVRTSVRIDDDSSAFNGLDEKKQERISISKNRPAFRLSIDKTNPLKHIDTSTKDIALSEKISERPMFPSSERRREEKPRQRFSLLKCFFGDAKPQDENQSRKKKKTEKKRQGTKTVRES
ncbi:unnamed protein product [Cochlearia groenlandica]